MLPGHEMLKLLNKKFPLLLDCTPFFNPNIFLTCMRLPKLWPSMAWRHTRGLERWRSRVRALGDPLHFISPCIVGPMGLSLSSLKKRKKTKLVKLPQDLACKRPTQLSQPSNPSFATDQFHLRNRHNHYNRRNRPTHLWNHRNRRTQPTQPRVK